MIKTIKIASTSKALSSYSFGSTWATVQAGLPPSILSILPDGVGLIPATPNLIGAVSWYSGITFDHIYISRPLLHLDLTSLHGCSIKTAKIYVWQVNATLSQNGKAHLVDSTFAVPITTADWTSVSDTYLSTDVGITIPFVPPTKATFTLNTDGVDYLNTCLPTGFAKLGLRPLEDKIVPPAGTHFESFLFYDQNETGFEPCIEVDYSQLANRAYCLSRRNI